MNPEFIDGMSWEMAEVYGAITDQILINLAHYFPYYKPGQPLPQSSFEYQANMLAQMGQVSKDTIRIIRNGLAGADGALQGVLEQAIIDSVRKAQPELLEAVKQGVLSPISKPVVSPSQMRAFNLYYTQAADKLNLVNTVMLESTQSAYQQCVSDVVSDIGLADSMNRVQIALDTAAGETVTGVESWNRALQHATDRLKEAGIVGFIDHAGRRWSAEAYVAMDIRTTVANTARAAVWETNQDFGNDLYQVSYHDGARPLCYPWQLKVISSTDNARTVTDLDGNEIEVIAQSATSYGKPAGLFGINCKHYPTPFIPGVSIIRGQVQPEKANEIAYEQSQEQRRLERKLREERRDILMAKAQGASPEEIGRLQAKANKTSADIDEFCAQTGLPRQRNRERVYTKREFPDANRYDVNAFERSQKEAIDKYFDNNGAQQNYSFGQMPVQTKDTTPKVLNSAEDFDKEIARLRQRRSELFGAETYDKSETDRLLKEVFDLEDKKAEFIAKQFDATLDASVVTTRPANEPDILKGFKRFDVSKRTDEQMLAQVNPNYKTHEHAWTYNCQRTVAAQEAIYRGYDVTAKEYHARDAIGDQITKVFKTTKDLYEDPNIVMLGNASTMESKLTEAFAEWGDGSRGVVRIYWNKANGSGGHFIYARNVGGKIILTDPQKGQFIPDGISAYSDRVTRNKQQMWVLRVDNRPFTDDIGLAMKNRGE